MFSKASFLKLEREKPRTVPFVVGIGGATGSGKTSLARALAESFRELGACLVDQDSYYLDRSHLNEKERQAVNFDEPAALDHDMVLRHLEDLLAGKVIEKPIYEFRTHTRTGGFQLIQPAALIILEGLYPFWDPRVSALMGLKVYIDADHDVRFIRRLRRDVVERGRSMESTITQYLDTVRPMQRLYIEPTKKAADIVIDTSDSFAKPVAELISAVAQRYSQERTASDMPPASDASPNGVNRFPGKLSGRLRCAK